MIYIYINLHETWSHTPKCYGEHSTLRTLLYGSENLDLTVNKRIVTETLRFIKDSKRFDL